MPRSPDPKTKTQQAYLRAKNLDEQAKIKAVKEICARNGDLQVRDVILKGFEQFLKEHNWPPGNSQTVLVSFSEIETSHSVTCSMCDRPAVDRAWMRDGGEAFFCTTHRREKRLRIKAWRPL